MAQLNTYAIRWVFTINNYKDNDINTLKDVFEKRLPVKYAIIGREVGEEGTPHLQGYVHFTKRVWRQTLKSELDPLNLYGYWEAAKGCEYSNFQYCSKSGDFVEIGERGKDVEREMNKKQRMIALMEDWRNLTQDDFDAKWPVESLMLRQKLRQWEAEHMTNISIWNGDLKEKNLWIWGPTGTGKSRWARTQGEKFHINIYPKMPNKWWSGFDPKYHRIVLIEDMPCEAKYLGQMMKIWADRYSFIGELKGSSITIDPGRFFLIITANYSIDECFEPGDADAIKRRFAEIHILNSNDIWLETDLPSVEKILIK